MVFIICEDLTSKKQRVLSLIPFYIVLGELIKFYKKESEMTITREQYHSLKGGHPTTFDIPHVRRYDQIRYRCLVNYGEEYRTGIMQVAQVKNGKVTCVL